MGITRSRRLAERRFSWLNAAALEESVGLEAVQLRRLNRAYRALCLCTADVARAASESELFSSVCETLVQVGGYRLAWVGIPDHETSRVVPVAAAGSPNDKAYLKEVAISFADDELGRGPTGTALRTGAVTVNRDTANDPSYASWRDRALGRGFRSSIAVPIGSGGTTVAALSVHASEPDAFDVDEQVLLARLADAVAVGVRALRTQSNLVALEARLRDAAAVRTQFAMLDHAPHGFLAMDHDGTVLYVNAAGAKLVGKPPESLIGTHVESVLPGTGSTAFREARLRVNASGKGELVEAYFPPLDSWFEAHFYKIATGVAVHYSDVSARKRLELALRQSDERFRQIAGSIDDVFWLTGPESGELFYINPAFERVWGRSCESLYASPHSWFDAIHPEDRDRVRQSLAKQRTGGWDEEFRIVRPDGTIRWTRSRAYPVRDAAGHVHRVAGVARDVTEQHLLEEQVRQGQKMEAVGRLAGGVAHDFNNLLSVILSYAQMLLAGLRPGDAMRADVEEIRLAGERAANLTRQLLAFSRQQVIQPRVVALRDVVVGMERLVRRLVGDDVDLSISGADPSGRVYADAGQIEQVVMNLAVNARDAMPAGGKLSIQTENVVLSSAFAESHPDVTPGSYVMLTVTDTGTGMDAATRERAFEPFFTTKGSGRGTGLGLATVFGVVKQARGHVSVDSEPGRGTTFRVYFPRTESPEASAAPPPAPDDRLRGTETILLVDDDDALRALMRGVLQRHGYEVLDASSGADATRISDEHARIDMLLTDVAMPHMNGPQLAERLAASRPGLRVLFVSGYAEDSIVHRGVLGQGVALLEKPVLPDALLRRVRSMLDART
jgi:PAS domain S-box-containing protein